MYTLLFILLLIFVPPFRRFVSGIFWGAMNLLGLMFLVTSFGERRRR